MTNLLSKNLDPLLLEGQQGDLLQNTLSIPKTMMDHRDPLYILQNIVTKIPFPVLEEYKVVVYKDDKNHLHALSSVPSASLNSMITQYFDESVLISAGDSYLVNWLLNSYSRANKNFVDHYENIIRWHKNISNENKSVQEFVDFLLRFAVSHKASDIHLEPQENYVTIKLRVAGKLFLVSAFSLKHWSFILRALKALADLNTAETRLPQEGRFNYKMALENIDCRLSSHPTHFGETVVIRVLNQAKQFVQLEKLGFSDETISSLKTLAKKEQGLIILTGPTGSGKTTTLYSMIDFIKDSSRNIVTLEDPVEYVMEGVRQSSVNNAAGFTLEEGVRSLLRQDPDVILIGEVRDPNTAKLAFRASLTGHLVLTTVHAGSVFGVISRLLEFGVHPRLLAESIHGILAQRLVPLKDELTRQARGELLLFDDQLREAIEESASISKLKKMAIKNGFNPLF